jgi:hypothetical protein
VTVGQQLPIDYVVDEFHIHRITQHDAISHDTKRYPISWFASLLASLSGLRCSIGSWSRALDVKNVLKKHNIVWNFVILVI